MMTDRDVWMKAAAILAKHDAMTTDYIIDQVTDALGDGVAVEDWRRVAVAVDQITRVSPHGSN